MYYRKRPFWTYILILTCIIVFIFQLFMPIERYTYFVPLYAFYRPWTFITSIFLHANFSHLFLNMFALFMFGTYLEQRIKDRTYLLIFFLAGIVGNLGYMLTAINSTTPGVGASGAIFGIIGAVAVLEPYAIVYFGFVPMPMIFAAFVWAILEILGLFVPSNIGHGAHLAGLVVGAIYAFYLRKRKRRIVRIVYF